MKSFLPFRDSKELGIENKKIFQVVNHNGRCKFKIGLKLRLVMDDRSSNPLFEEMGPVPQGFKRERDWVDWSCLAFPNRKPYTRKVK